MARKNSGCAGLAGLLFFGFGFLFAIATVNPVMMLLSLFMVWMSAASLTTVPDRRRGKKIGAPPPKPFAEPSDSSFLDSLSDQALAVLYAFGPEAYNDLYSILVLHNPQFYSRAGIPREVERLKQLSCSTTGDEYIDSLTFQSRAIISRLGSESILWMLADVRKIFPEIGEVGLQNFKQSGRDAGFRRDELLRIKNRLDAALPASIVKQDVQNKPRVSEAALEEVMQELDQLVGIQSAKDAFRQIIATKKIDMLRERSGVKVLKSSLSLVLLGPPGTGKTVVARLYGRALAAIGCLSKGHFIEVSKSDLIGQYLGETANKTKVVLEQALGGVLFVDEAYSIVDGGSSGNVNAYGKECIAELIKVMEDSRDDICVILAGYKKEMMGFLEMNPGLASRFPSRIYFESYKCEELRQILILMMKSNGWDYPLEEVVSKSLEYLESLRMSGSEGFGNAREVRNLIDKIYKHQSLRLAASGSSLSSKDLRCILPSDVPPPLR